MPARDAAMVPGQTVCSKPGQTQREKRRSGLSLVVRPLKAGVPRPGKGEWPGSKWGLTARESEALALVATGMPNRALAEALFVSENTVRTHLKAVFRNLASRTAARPSRELSATRVLQATPRILTEEPEDLG